MTLIKEKRTNIKKSRNDGGKKHISTHRGNIQKIVFSCKMKIALVRDVGRIES